MNILNFLSPLGFSDIDTLMIIICPVLGLLGGLVHALMVDMAYSKSPKYRDYSDLSTPNEEIVKEVVQHRGVWIVSRILIGGATGLVLAFYFAGAITPEATSVGRIFAMSVVAGYLAPSFWKHQQDIPMDKMLKSIRS